jgi:hypothetical protein
MIGAVPEKLAPTLRRWRHRLREPRFGLEIGSEWVRGVRLRPVDKGWRLDAGAEAALPKGALPMTFRRTEPLDEEALGSALSHVAERLGAVRRRVAVALPDALIKLQVERFPALPEEPAEARRLAAWQAARRFGVSAADLSVDLFPLGMNADGEPEAVVASALRPAIRAYEAAIRSAGMDPEPILPAAVARLNLHAGDLPDEGRAILLIFTDGYFHLLLVEVGRLIRLHSIRGGLGGNRLGRDLFLVAEQLRDDLGDRKIDTVYLADPGAPLWNVAPALDGLFSASLTILRPDRRLAEVALDEAEGPDPASLGTAIGAAAGLDIGLDAGLDGGAAGREAAA